MRGARLAVLAVAVVGAVLALRAFVVEPFAIPSESMAPTLRPGDRVLVDKLASVHRGDLVVFHAPRSRTIELKRVVAVGGDTVAIEDGVLLVDGRRRAEPYADARAIDSVYFGPVRVPRGSLFVLGDNRANSADSRAFGALPARDVIGRARARVWPPARWGAPR